MCRTNTHAHSSRPMRAVCKKRAENARYCYCSFTMMRNKKKKNTVDRTDRTYRECKLKTTDEIFCCAVENQNSKSQIITANTVCEYYIKCLLLLLHISCYFLCNLVYWIFHHWQLSTSRAFTICARTQNEEHTQTNTATRTSAITHTFSHSGHAWGYWLHVFVLCI